MGFLQEVKSRAVETQRDLKKAQDTIAVLHSYQKTLTDKVSSLTGKVSSVRVERVKLRVNSDDKAALV